MATISAPAKILRAFILPAAVDLSAVGIVSPAQAEPTRAEAPALVSGRLSVEVMRQGAAMTTPVWAVYASDADGGAPAALIDAFLKSED